MRHKNIHTKLYLTIGLAAALIICILCAHVYALHHIIADTRESLRTSEASVDAYIVELSEMREAYSALQYDCSTLQDSYGSLQADNDTLRRSNDELQNTNSALQEALTVYDYDFSVKAPAPPRYMDVPLDEDLQDYIWSLCCMYDIDEHYELIYAMIQQESNFKSGVISSTNDYGLMQINKSNHSSLSQRLGVTDFLDPYQNVHAGIYLMANLLHKYDTPKALMSYNMGEGGASKLWRQGIYTTSYTEAVLDAYNQFTEDI